MQPELFHGPQPAIAGKYSGRCLVVGPGWTMNDDLKQWDGQGDLMVVNSAGMVFDRFDHWFTPHPEYLALWREPHKTRVESEVHCKQGGLASDGSKLHFWPIDGHFAAWGGESAAVVAVALGYDEILLAGIPADGNGKATNDPIQSTADHGEDYSFVRWRWLRDNYFHGRVKSLSGNTKDILG